MAASELLLLTEIAFTQAQADQAITDNFARVERAFNDTIDVDMSGGDVTLSVFDIIENVFFRVINAGVITRNITIPSEVLSLTNPTKRILVFHSDSANAVDVKIFAQGNPVEIATVTPGGTVTVYINGSTGYIISSHASQAASSPALTYEVHAYVAGQPIASEEVTRVPFAQTVTFSGNFAGSRGSVKVNPTNTYTVDIRKNNVSVGNATIATNGAVSFVSNGGNSVIFNPGDVMTLVGQAAVDGTLEGPALLLIGSK